MISNIRAAALKVQAMEIRREFAFAILDTLELDPTGGYDEGTEPLDHDALIVARFVTTLADALGQYVVTGEVTTIAAEPTTGAGSGASGIGE
jgi:hypothetical protein